MVLYLAYNKPGTDLWEYCYQVRVVHFRDTSRLVGAGGEFGVRVSEAGPQTVPPDPQTVPEGTVWAQPPNVRFMT